MRRPPGRQTGRAMTRRRPLSVIPSAVRASLFPAVQHPEQSQADPSRPKVGLGMRTPPRRQTGRAMPWRRPLSSRAQRGICFSPPCSIQGSHKQIPRPKVGLGMTRPPRRQTGRGMTWRRPLSSRAQRGICFSPPGCFLGSHNQSPRPKGGLGMTRPRRLSSRAPAPQRSGGEASERVVRAALLLMTHRSAGRSRGGCIAVSPWIVPRPPRGLRPQGRIG